MRPLSIKYTSHYIYTFFAFYIYRISILTKHISSHVILTDRFKKKIIYVIYSLLWNLIPSGSGCEAVKEGKRFGWKSWTKMSSTLKPYEIWFVFHRKKEKEKKWSHSFLRTSSTQGTFVKQHALIIMCNELVNDERWVRFSLISYFQRNTFCTNLKPQIIPPPIPE